MRSLSKFTVCVIAAGLMHHTAFAQPAASAASAVSGAGAAAPSIQFAAQAAWLRSVQSRSAEGRLDHARAGQSVAASPWAAPPALELGHRTDRLNDSLGRRESEIGVAWPLWLPGQRVARGNAADAELGAAESSRLAERLRSAGDVREAAWSLQAVQAERAAAKARAATLSALTADVERRVKAGDLARADALAVRAESLAADAEVAASQGRLDAARVRWRALTGVEPLLDPSEASVNGTAPEHPELALALLEIERARKRLDLNRVSRRDPPELLLRYRQDTAGAGAALQNSVGVALRIPFGTDDRNLPRDAAALAELDIAQARERSLRLRIEADINIARSAAVLAERQLGAEESRAALLRERAQLIGQSFRAGQTALPEQLRALAAADQAAGSLARQRAELGLARARLKQSLGILP